jgi:hypothetical protein
MTQKPKLDTNSQGEVKKIKFNQLNQLKGKVVIKDRKFIASITTPPKKEIKYKCLSFDDESEKISNQDYLVKTKIYKELEISIKH